MSGHRLRSLPTTAKAATEESILRWMAEVIRVAFSLAAWNHSGMNPLPIIRTNAFQKPAGVLARRIRRFCRTLLLVLGLLLAAGSARAEFTLRLQPGDPGTMSLQFTLAPGYYYSLERSPDLLTGYTQASGWMLGNDNIEPVSWPIHYPTSPSAGGGTAGGSTDTFALYPFPENKTLVTWEDFSATRYRALIAVLAPRMRASRCGVGRRIPVTCRKLCEGGWTCQKMSPDPGTDPARICSHPTNHAYSGLDQSKKLGRASY